MISPRPRIAILYPTDPVGHVPGGIDSIIKGILKESPADLDYTLFGATSDPAAHPLALQKSIRLGRREVGFIPLVRVDAEAVRSRIPLTVRYMWELWRSLRRGALAAFDVLDFHRFEPLMLFRRDPRPKNIVVHQDMSAIRADNADIMWRHAPWLYDEIERRLLPSVESLVTVRRSAIERYAALQPGRQDRFHFMPTWADTEVFGPCSSQRRKELRAGLLTGLGIAENSVLLVFVGRFDGQKDPLLLLRAMRAVSRDRTNLHLVMVGGGVLQREVEAGIRGLGLVQRVSLAGVLPSASICEVLQAGDLFVMSSSYEGMPVAVLEALATGLPVVSTPAGEVPMVVKNGQNGYIATDHSVESLARAMAAALDDLDSLRGLPCLSSVAQFSPQTILAPLYERHRNQAAK